MRKQKQFTEEQKLQLLKSPYIEKGLSVGHTCPTINFVLISIYELS